MNGSAGNQQGSRRGTHEACAQIWDLKGPPCAVVFGRRGFGKRVFAGALVAAIRAAADTSAFLFLTPHYCVQLFIAVLRITVFNSVSDATALASLVLRHCVCSK